MSSTTATDWSNTSVTGYMSPSVMAKGEFIEVSGNDLATAGSIRFVTNADGNTHYTLANLSTADKTIKKRNVRRNALIGWINKYQNPANWLNGAVPDALDMAETLKILKFPRKNIHVLLDGEATTDGILKGLDWLTKDAQPGDVLIFFYSGHGSQVYDINGDEEDRIDEIICPADIDFDNEKYITDDVLHDYFTNKVPSGTRTDVILDSCFSGTATRAVAGVSDGWINKNVKRRQRFMPPPPQHLFQINSTIPQFTKIIRFGTGLVITNGDDKKPEASEGQQHNCLLSGCDKNQYSEEVEMDGGEIRGVLTYYFTRILRRSNGDITRGEAFSILKSSVANDGFTQRPTLEVPVDHPEAVDLFFFRKASEVDQASEVKPPKK